MRVDRASLHGVGWGPWRGNWKSAVRLEGRAGDWRLRNAEREIASWTSIVDALSDLWQERRVRDDSPWVVGWLSYSTCAHIAGDLPALPDPKDAHGGVLLVEPQMEKNEPILKDGRASNDADLVSSLTDAEFAAGVEEIRREIEAGSVYQVNLCRRFSMTPWAGGLASLLRVSAGEAEPDYLCAMTWGGDRSGELVCGSMEMLLRRRGMRLETRPIKGTRRRGVSPEDDLAFIRDLETDPKEIAELSMIVDLERNDLGRVAVPGSVCVEDPGAVFSWPFVHHRVARISADLHPTKSTMQLIEAMVPGGSVTGCPKRAAMEVISKIEPVSRGPFTGALGVVAGNGDLELALPIRTAWTVGDSLEMASGCGVVWQSEPQKEVAESRLKLTRWIDLLEGRGS